MVFWNTYLKLSYYLVLFQLSYIYCEVSSFLSYLKTDVGLIYVSGILNAYFLVY